jgi:hypothetical protein
VVHGAEVSVFPQATAGGFASDRSTVQDGAVEIELVAGDPEAEAEDGEETPANAPVEVGTTIRLYVSFEAEDGGSALWRSTMTVE